MKKPIYVNMLLFYRGKCNGLLHEKTSNSGYNIDDETITMNDENLHPYMFV